MAQNGIVLFEKLSVSWKLVLRDGTVITPENLPDGAAVHADWSMENDTTAGSAVPTGALPRSLPTGLTTP